MIVTSNVNEHQSALTIHEWIVQESRTVVRQLVQEMPSSLQQTVGTLEEMEVMTFRLVQEIGRQFVEELATASLRVVLPLPFRERLVVRIPRRPRGLVKIGFLDVIRIEQNFMGYHHAPRLPD